MVLFSPESCIESSEEGRRSLRDGLARRGVRTSVPSRIPGPQEEKDWSRVTQHHSCLFNEIQKEKERVGVSVGSPRVRPSEGNAAYPVYLGARSGNRGGRATGPFPRPCCCRGHRRWLQHPQCSAPTVSRLLCKVCCNPLEAKELLKYHSLLHFTLRGLCPPGSPDYKNKLILRTQRNIADGKCKSITSATMLSIVTQTPHRPQVH